MEIAVNFNQTIFLVDPESQKRQKYSYSYIGPVLIGIGGKFQFQSFSSILERCRRLKIRQSISSLSSINWRCE